MSARAADDAASRIARLATGATWLDLVATVGEAYGPAPVEHMIDVGALSAWLSAVGFEPRRAVTATDLDRARELREALRGLALAQVRSTRPRKRDVDRLNAFLAAGRPLKLSSRASRGLALGQPATATDALERIARQAAEDLTGPAAATLRVCADEACGMLFLDASGRRRWCTADVCGVRNRVRAHRRRLSTNTMPTKR